eukprot:CAMPEP_0204919136 /NCGR_PEP_ID=MMETSP1397-20131031/16654_1 /ASSEMBLY_ACC=CAM_ASM_000891 /TAXON_ID=49980 /ORGANISM="Climacostomum Climacostomum virens, Strain Stock W-24" /LENGTH=77 /DNA_ID=CAMNT_0052092697 /DNA_START=180 /DNA_END=413 /DNA_ORIENTATION=-
MARVSIPHFEPKTVEKADTTSTPPNKASTSLECSAICPGFTGKLRPENSENFKSSLVATSLRDFVYGSGLVMQVTPT